MQGATLEAHCQHGRGMQKGAHTQTLARTETDHLADSTRDILQ